MDKLARLHHENVLSLLDYYPRDDYGDGTKRFVLRIIFHDGTPAQVETSSGWRAWWWYYVCMLRNAQVTITVFNKESTNARSVQR